MMRHCGPLRAIILAIVCSGLCFGCPSGPRKIGQPPSWRQASQTEEPAAEDTVRIHDTTPIVFAPSSPAVQAYNDPPIAPPPSSPLADAMVATLDAVYGDAGMTPPRPDGRLFAAATELAAIVPEDTPPAYPLVEFALQRHGIIEPSPHLVLIWGPLDDPGPVVEQLRERLPSIVAEGTATGSFARMGVGAHRRRGNEGVIILALQDSHIETRPIPRALPTGGAIAVEGRILGDYRQPEVFVTREDGTVEHVASGRGAEFQARIPCRNRRGKQQVEITAEDRSGSTVLANFPVWCNALPPTSITIRPAAEDQAPVRTPAEAEARMLSLVNEDRKRHGLGPLILAEDVSAVARAHSDEMQRTGLVGHVSPITGSAADRVQAANIRTSMVLENIARAYGVAEAQEGLMNSPGHRANLLSPQATHIGIGIVFGEVMAGRRAMFVTQVFTRVPPPITPTEARSRIHEMIATHARVAHDEPLAVLAQQYAEGMVAGMSAAEMSKRTAQKLDAFRNRFRKVATSVVAVADIESFDAQEPFADGETTHYGLGVAQGAHAELGDRTLFIVLLLAQKR